MMSWGFYFSATPGNDVRDGEIRLDAPPPYVGHVTRLYVDNLDRDGQFIRNIVRGYGSGTTIYLETGNRFASFRILSAPRERSGHVEIPVTCISASVEGLTAGPVDAAFLRGAAREIFSARDAATDPDLVTLVTAKAHLHITSTDHDADVSQKLTAASATIRDYLKDRNDPAWTPATVPPWIGAAVLLLLGHMYEHRGDEFGAAQDNDDRVWEAIANLLRRSRDPSLA